MKGLSGIPYGFGCGIRNTPVRITNPELLQKIETACSMVCLKCNTVRTCSMYRDRHLMDARPLLECSVVKAAGYGV